jgi:transcriptional regulator with XRE-family HTH domain
MTAKTDRVLSAQTREFGRILAALRQSRQPAVSQRELARRALCAPSHVNRLERGLRAPTAEIVDAFAQALDLSGVETQRLRRAAQLSPMASATALERLVTTLTAGDHHDELALRVMRVDLTDLAEGWRSFLVGTQLLRQGQVIRARKRFRALLRRKGATPALRLSAGRYLAKALDELGANEDAVTLLTRLRASPWLKDALAPAEAALLRASFAALLGDIALRSGLYGRAGDWYSAAQAEYRGARSELPAEEEWVGHTALGLATLLLAKAANFEGDYAEALRQCDASEAHWAQASPPGRATGAWSQRQEGLLRAKEFRAWALSRRGDFDDADAVREEARRDAEASRQPRLLMRNRLYAGDDFRRRIQERVALTQQLPHYGHVSPGVALDVVRGEVKPWIAAAARAYVAAHQLGGRSSQSHDPSTWGLCLRNLAIVHRYLRRFDEAERLLGQAERFERDRGQEGRLPSIYEAWGDVKWDRGDLAQAQERYAQAQNALGPLLTKSESEDRSRREQQARLDTRLAHLAAQVQAASGAGQAQGQAQPPPDDRPTRVWLEWRQTARRLIARLDEALYRAGAKPVATRDLDERWIRELAALELLGGTRFLAQDRLSMSLVGVISERVEGPAAHVHALRSETFFARIAKWRDELHPAAHDLCCRPTIEGAMADTVQRARAHGALHLLRSAPAAYQLDAGLFSLPVSFAVKADRVLVELPPRIVTRYAMQVERFLAPYTSARQFCFRFDDPALAADLRALFGVLVRLARSSTLHTVGAERHEESPQHWLAALLRQWEESDDQTPITPSI